jgi:isoleucyl-tRNA synthetase
MAVGPYIPLLLSANSAIKTAQEEARAKKLIGSSLQSRIVLDIPDAEAMTVLEAYRHDLRDIFVVSDVELAEPRAASALRAGAEADENTESIWHFEAEFDISGGTGKGVARVMPPHGAKCPRCWRYVAPKEDELCGRCEDVTRLD